MIKALLLLLAMPAGAESYGAKVWPDMLEACVRYAETGQRAVFKGWDVAFPGGGVCNGDPACERSEMTFIGNGCFQTEAEAVTLCGYGAVTVRVAEPVVGDEPVRVTCGNPVGWPALLEPDVFEQHELWIAQAVTEKRLIDDGESWLGCFWDGQGFRLSARLVEPYVAQFSLVAPVSENAGCQMMLS